MQESTLVTFVTFEGKEHVDQKRAQSHVVNEVHEHFDSIFKKSKNQNFNYEARFTYHSILDIAPDIRAIIELRDFLNKVTKTKTVIRRTIENTIDNLDIPFNEESEN